MMPNIKLEKQELHSREREISKIEIGVVDAGFEIGKLLAEIRDHKLYEAEGIRSWSEYCRSGRVDLSKRRCDQLISTARISARLPKTFTDGTDIKWSLRGMEQLARLESHDAKRVAKRVVRHAEKTKEELTGALIKHFVDVDAGVARRQAEKVENKARERAKHQEEHSQLSHHVEALKKEIMLRKRVFELVADDTAQWDELTRKSNRDIDELIDSLRTTATIVENAAKRNR